MSVASAEGIRVEQDKGPEVTYLLEHELFVSTAAAAHAAYLWELASECHPELVKVIRDGDDGPVIDTQVLTIEEALRRSDTLQYDGRSMELSVFAMSICTRANKSIKMAVSVVEQYEMRNQGTAQALDVSAA